MSAGNTPVHGDAVGHGAGSGRALGCRRRMRTRVHAREGASQVARLRMTMPTAHHPDTTNVDAYKTNPHSAPPRGREWARITPPPPPPPPTAPPDRTHGARTNSWG